MNNITNEFYTHCRIADFENKVRYLESLGWTVDIDDVFLNFRGEKFVRFSYSNDPNIPMMAHVKNPQAMNKRILDLMKENL
jgi:hypothetical protein